MERYFERARLHEKVKVEFASDYLLSYARYFFRQLTKDKQPTWKELTNALVMNYDSTNRQSKLKKSLRELRQISDVNKYIRDFDKIVNQIHNMDAGCILDQFLEGLKPDLSRSVRIASPRSLIDAKEAAIRLYDPHEEKQSKSLAVTQNQEKPVLCFNPACDEPDVEGHECSKEARLNFSLMMMAQILDETSLIPET